MGSEFVLASSALLAVALTLALVWTLRGSRLEGVRQWIGEFCFLRDVQADINKLARATASLQKTVSNLQMQLKAVEAEMDASPSIHSFCVLRERVDRLEAGWVMANSVKRIVDADNRNLKELRSQMDLLYKKVDGLAANSQNCRSTEDA